MINELIIHLGDTKTGSTSIQRALVQRAYAVPGTEILYPGKNHHNVLVRSLIRVANFSQREKRFRAVYQKLSRSTAAYGIISAEHFQFADPEIFARTVEEYWPGLRDKMRLVAYVRPHHEKLLSSFSERVKLGHVRSSFEDFFQGVSESAQLDYLPRFSKWRDVFGDRFTLRPFVRSALVQGDVVTDFFRYVLGHENFKITGEVTANSSLTLPQLALLRRMHDVLADRVADDPTTSKGSIFDARAAFGRVLNEYVEQQKLGTEGDKLLVPKGMTAAITDRYARDAAALDAEFFDAQPMSDALSQIERKTTAKSQSLDADDYFQPETLAVINVFANLMAAMLIEDPKQFQQLAHGVRLMYSPS